jgi:hypothetical protein
MTIDSIITEWTFRLEAGYPRVEADYDILHDVIMEMTDFSDEVAHRIVEKAKGTYDGYIYDTDYSEETLTEEIDSENTEG